MLDGTDQACALGFLLLDTLIALPAIVIQQLQTLLVRLWQQMTYAVRLYYAMVRCSSAHDFCCHACTMLSAMVRCGRDACLIDGLIGLFMLVHTAFWFQAQVVVDSKPSNMHSHHTNDRARDRRSTTVSIHGYITGCHALESPY